MNSVEIWSKFQRGEKLRIEDVAFGLYGIDVSGYCKTVENEYLARFREREVGCDGTASLTIQTLHEMIEPIITQGCYDKAKGEPHEGVVGITYECSPIEYTCEMKQGTFNGGRRGLMQMDRFYIRYNSEFVYDN